MTPHRPSTHDTDDRSDMDERAIRRAAAAGDVPALIAATDGVRIDPGLQLVGYVAVGLWRAADPDRRALLEPLLARLRDELGRRAGAGDGLLAAELAALLTGQEPAGTQLPIDLEDFVTGLHLSFDGEIGALLDPRTGETVPAAIAYGDDAGYRDEEHDEEYDVDDWLLIVDDANDRHDLAAFVDTLPQDSDIRHRLARAIQGRGAFRRFNDIVHKVDLHGRWTAFREDRQWGRARELLDEHGLRP